MRSAYPSPSRSEPVTAQPARPLVDVTLLSLTEQASRASRSSGESAGPPSSSWTRVVGSCIADTVKSGQPSPLTSPTGKIAPPDSLPVTGPSQVQIGGPIVRETSGSA